MNGRRAEVRGWRILLQPKLLPNGIHDLGWTLPDIGHYGRLRFLEIGHLTGQNGLPGEVPVPLQGPHGEGWGTVMVPVPAGASDGARFPLRGLGPGGGDLPVRLRVREPDERAAWMENSRHYAWLY